MGRKVIIFITVMTIVLFVYTNISEGLTSEQAIEDVKNQVVQRGLSPKEEVMGTGTINRLTSLGISVDSAYQLVIASFDYGIRAKKLAPIVRAIEIVNPVTGPRVVNIAVTAIENGYNRSGF
jgi:hypothetical protein